MELNLIKLLIEQTIQNPLDYKNFLFLFEELKKQGLSKESKEAKKIYSALKLTSQPLEENVLFELAYKHSDSDPKVSEYYYVTTLIVEPFNYQIFYNLSNVIGNKKNSEVLLINSTFLGVYSIWPWTKLARILIEKSLIIEGLRAFYVACLNYDPLIDREKKGIQDLIDFLDEFLGDYLDYSKSYKLPEFINKLQNNKDFLVEFLNIYKKLAVKFYDIQKKHLVDKYHDFLEKYKLFVLLVFSMAYPNIVFITENFRGDFVYILNPNVKEQEKNLLKQLELVSKKLEEDTILLYLIGVKDHVLVLGLDKNFHSKRKDFLPLNFFELKNQDEIPFIKKLLLTLDFSVDPGSFLKRILEIFYKTIEVLKIVYELQIPERNLKEKNNSRRIELKRRRFRLKKELADYYSKFSDYFGEDIHSWRELLLKIWNISTEKIEKIYSELLNKIEYIVSILFEPLGKIFLELKKQGYQKLYLIPMGTIVNFPLHIMKLNNSSYLLEEFEISYLPPLKFRNVKHERGNNLKIIGLIAGEQKDSKDGLRSFFEDLKKSLLKNRLNAEEVTITEAEHYKVINIIAHGKFNLKEPKNSYIKIGDNNYKVVDLLSILNVNEYVLLPSCQVGFSDKIVFDINAGIPSVFFVKGYKGALVSIVDTLTNYELKEFLIEINKHLIDGNPLSKAYRRASLKLIKNKNKEKLNIWRIFIPYEYP